MKTATDGTIPVTIISGTSPVGAFNADGSANAVFASGTVPRGIRHPSGALWVTVGTGPGAYAPDGSLYVMAVPGGYALLKAGVSLQTFATWDPATKGATAVLSNNNLTLTNPAASGDNNVKALSTSFKTVGKFVVKIVVVNVTDANLGIGLGKSPIPASGFAADTNSCGAYNDAIYNNTFTSLGNTGGAWANGNDIWFAANLDTAKFWVKKNAGNWNNNVSANPDTGVGGFAFSSGMTAGSSLYLMGWASGPSASCTLDPNPGGSGLTTFGGWSFP